MGPREWGLVVVLVAILLMVAQSVFAGLSDLVFFVGLWLGVAGIMMINSRPNGRRDVRARERAAAAETGGDDQE